MDAGEQQSGAGGRRLWIVACLIASLPLVMAVTTWTPDGYFSVPLYFWRFLAPPVLFAELLVTAIAWIAGFRPAASIIAMPRWIAITIGLLVAIDVGTALFVAPDGHMATMRATMTLTHLMFGLATAHLLSRQPAFDYRSLWWALGLGATAYLTAMFVFVLSISDPEAFGWLHFGLGVVNIRHAGFYVALGAAMALGLAATETSAPRYWSAVALLTLCVAEFFWSGSRAPVIAIVAASIIGAVLVPAFRTVRLFAALVLGGAGGAVLSLVHVPPLANYGLLRMVKSGSQATANDVASGRVDLWMGSLEALARRPLFGFGESQYIIVVPQAQEIYYHPHNIILQLLVQWGLIGTLAFAALAIAAWWRLYRGVLVTGERALPAFMGTNVFAIYAMFDGVLFFVYPMMIVAFLTAAGLVAVRRDCRPAPGS